MIIEFVNDSYLSHHGRKGQEWGIRNGPPYPLKPGLFYEDGHLKRNKKAKKGYKDFTVSRGTKLQTLSTNANRTKDTDYFYSTFKHADSWFYGSNFAKKDVVEAGQMFKIVNKFSTDVKIAGEKACSDVFKKLYSSDADFYNFVKNPDRLEKDLHMPSTTRYKEYVDALKSLEKIRSEKSVSSKDLESAYRLFNRALPADGDRGDMARQREKFFSELKKLGYSALLDSNDATYAAYSNFVKRPIIVFDMDSIIPDEIKQFSMNDRRINQLLNSFV